METEMEAGSRKRMKTCSEWTNGVEMEVGSQKRSKTCNGWPSDGGFSKFAALNGVCYGSSVTQTPSKVNGQGDPFALPLLLENLANGKYGSVTREFEALHAQNMQMMNVLYALRSSNRGSSSSPAVVSPISNIENPVSTHKHGHNLSEQPAGKLFHSNGPNAIQDSKKDSENAISIPIHIEKSNGNSTPQDPHLTSQLETNGMQIIVIDSDDETEPPTCSRHEADDSRLWQIMPQESIHQDQLKTPFHGSHYGQVLNCQTSGYGTIDSVDACRNIWQPSVKYEKVLLTNNTEKGPLLDLVDEKHETNFSLLRKLGASPRPRHNKLFPQFAKSTINNKENNNERKNKLESNATEKAIFDEDMQQESPSLESMSEGTLDGDSEASETDGLDDLWKDMSLAMECSKSAVVDVPLAVKRGEEEECDHSYVLKDDLGLVCRICGIIQKSIEKIFDYQWAKGSRTIRTYFSESRNTRDSERSISFSGLKSLEHDLLAAEIAIHPRHEKQMKPHQLEGFSFLVRNLVSDKPGGCILAHAPGSGKTFMLISFIQSFLGKYPFARPLIILPKGILSTWKREFKKWQVEEIPLYDFYSVKADSRSQQLEVLKNWVEEKSILFLGYKQFSNIVCDAATSIAAGQCRESLLKVPSLLIIDEGHTPRNDNTDVLHSLAKIQTPRKVVLSGTLFQNHVKEVFNILNLVRPKFLKMDASRAVVGRIMSRVQISGARNRTDINAHFFECVEETLQNEDNSKRKVTVIRDLREMTKEVLHYYKGDFLEELPGFVDFTVLLKLSLKQKAFVRKLGKMDKFRRSSLCSAIYLHPYLNEISENITVEKGYAYEEKIDSIINRLDVSDGIKTKFFLNILSMAVSAGERVLVYSQYLLPLKFLERLLARMKGWRSGKEMFTISGDSSPDQRELAMEQINSSPDAKILFGSIKACGEGISLVGASRVIILDVHLNPSVSRQAIGRAFRPGQTKKVHVYRLVAADSSEEEDHMTSFRKELTSKMWFEWNEYGDDQEFELGAVDVQDSEDVFFGNPYLNEDVKCLYKR